MQSMTRDEPRIYGAAAPTARSGVVHPETESLHLMEFASSAGYSGRSVRVADSPTLSVVVTSAGERGDLESGLDLLLRSNEAVEAQIVVVRVAQPEEVSDLGVAYPTIRFVAAPGGTPLSELRVMGMRLADGDVVILGEDNRISAEWLTPRLQAAN